MATKGFKIALIQMPVVSNKVENLSKAEQLARTAAENGASIISLPECFNCPYGTEYFVKYVEPIPGQSTDMLSSLAKELEVFIVGGSIPEEDDGKYFNTCTVFSPSGELIAKHRKIHLVNVDVPGKYRLCEPDVLSPGDTLTTFETVYCKVGIGICNDIRFSEMALLYAKRGCKLLFYPSVFNTTTGPPHWELLIRSKALDNQIYVAGINPSRDETTTYVSYGHSMVASPWGDVIAQCQHQEEIVYAEIDLGYLDQVRSQIPITLQKRPDCYSVEDKKSA